MEAEQTETAEPAAQPSPRGVPEATSSEHSLVDVSDQHRSAGSGEGGAPEGISLDDPRLYLNRELSWMAFNDRVLQLVEDPGTPLLERLKFCAIWTSNLDEHYMVRVAGLYDQLEAGLKRSGADGLSPREQIDRTAELTADQQARVSECFEQLRPQLAERGIYVRGTEEARRSHGEALRAAFEDQIYPVLTPLAIGQGRPFPYISNLSLSLAVLLRDPESENEIFARVKVPKEALPRFVHLQDAELTLVPLEELIADNLDQLFPGMEIVDHALFRVTRDLDYDVSDDADDLLQAVEEEVRRRRFGEVVRLEISEGMDARLRRMLVENMRLDDEQIYEVAGMLDLSDLWEIYKLPGHDEDRDPSWTPVTQPRLQSEEGTVGPDVLGQMRQGDLLVHHPYDSFVTSVERFVEQAAADPEVLAIKQTVYRTSDDSPLVPALIRATERGKQAVCMVELKARFDEEANIQWGRALEESGVHVVYGVPNLKTHAKCVLVVRREGEGVGYYTHIGTGNYNPTTAKLYTDLGLLTTNPEIGADVADMFNHLTGYGRRRSYRKVLLAPGNLRSSITEEIERTIEAHRDGEDARIAMKMNSLQDPECIRALYEASRAGVPVRLNVRGICCLVPGLEGVSEQIEVVSVVGRFLEHSRIYCFTRGDTRHVYIGSADLMVRNLDNRVELIAPVEDEGVRDEVIDVLERSLADEANAWELRPDGSWEPREQRADPPRDVHRELMEQAAARAADAAADTDSFNLVEPGHVTRASR